MDHSAEREWAEKYIYPFANRIGLTLEGAENMPKKGYVILFPNHGGWFAFDWITIYSVIAHEIEEYLAGFINPILFKIPGLGFVLQKCGALTTEQFQDMDLVKRYSRIYTIASEGAEGTTKPFTEGYRLRPFRPGFIKLALKLRAKLVPLSVV